MEIKLSLTVCKLIRAGTPNPLIILQTVLVMPETTPAYDGAISTAFMKFVLTPKPIEPAPTITNPIITFETAQSTKARPKHVAAEHKRPMQYSYNSNFL